MSIVAWFSLALGALADTPAAVGTRVMLKETARPQVGSQRLTWSSVALPANVEQVNGKWLWLGAAWVREDEVVSLDDAPAYFTDLIRRAPSSSAGYALRGLSWVAKGEYQNAIKDLTEAIRIEPSNGTYFTVRGKAQYMLHAYDAALADFTEAIRLDPKNLVAYNDRGATWSAKGEYQKAHEQFQEVLRIAPNNALALSNRGTNWFKRDEPAKALADLNEAIRLDPKMVPAYVNRGHVLTKQGDYPDAIVDYDTAVRLGPHEWEGYGGWARILGTSPWEQLRDGRRAAELATKACELSRWEEWRCVAALAAAEAAQGHYEAAVKWQVKAMALSQPAEEKDQLANEKRLKLFQSGRPFIEEVPAAPGAARPVGDKPSSAEK